MPSIFDLFGTLSLDTRSFEGSIKSVENKLKQADGALNKTISTSNKLGDTSATVGRRYEKLGEGIETQRQRLLANALAFEKGEINAKKFATVISQVDRATDSLNSRLKDAAARATELSETGFTHFQNQIKGAVDNSSRDLFKNLSYFQKQQLGFQANDIITGLLSGQNLTQILAQQGGQVVQIFQQGKSAAQATAVATNAAAIAETKFAASAQAAAVAEGEVALSAKATALATTEASGAMTVFGASLVAVGAVAAAGTITILAAKRASEDILKVAQDRLKAEEAIAAAMNKQFLAAQELKAKLAEQTYNSQFDQYLKNATIGILQRDQKNLQGQYDANLRGLTGPPTADFTAKQSALAEQIAQIHGRLLELQSALPTTVEIYQRAIDNAVKAQDVETKAKQQAAKAAEDFANKLDASIAKVEQRIQSLTSQYLQTPQKEIEALGYARQAQEFRQGFRFGPESASQKLQRELQALIPTEFKNITAGFVSGGALPTQAITRLQQVFSPKKLTPDEQHALDQEIIGLTKGLNPADLTRGQRDIVAGAFGREDKRDKDAIKQVITDLKDAIREGGALVTIRNESDRARVISRPTAATTDAYYNK